MNLIPMFYQFMLLSRIKIFHLSTTTPSPSPPVQPPPPSPTIWRLRFSCNASMPLTIIYGLLNFWIYPLKYYLERQDFNGQKQKFMIQIHDQESKVCKFFFLFTIYFSIYGDSVGSGSGSVEDRGWQRARGCHGMLIVA